MSFLSCSTKKVSMSKIEKNTKVDSSFVTKTDSTYINSNNIFIDEKFNEIEYIPVDSLKPMVINKIEFKNTIIKTKRYSKKIVDTTNTSFKISKEERVILKKEIKNNESKKNVDKKSNYSLLLLITITISIGYITWRSRSYILKFVGL